MASNDATLQSLSDKLDKVLEALHVGPSPDSMTLQQAQADAKVPGQTVSIDLTYMLVTYARQTMFGEQRWTKKLVIAG